MKQFFFWHKLRRVCFYESKRIVTSITGVAVAATVVLASFMQAMPVFANHNQKIEYVITNSTIYRRSGVGYGTYIPESNVQWGSIDTKLSDTVPDNAEAIVFYFDTTENNTGGGNAPEVDENGSYYNFLVMNFSSEYDGAGAVAYSSEATDCLPASYYGVNEVKCGILRNDATSYARIPAMGYGYLVVEAPNLKPGSSFSDAGRFYLNPWTGCTPELYLGAFGYVTDLETFKTQMNTEFSASKARIDDVKAKIAAIGTVTLNSGNAIAAARKAYDSLDEGNSYTPEKNLADPTGILEAAELKYAQISNPASWATLNLKIEGTGSVSVDGESYQANAQISVLKNTSVSLQLKTIYGNKLESLSVSGVDVTDKLKDGVYTVEVGTEDLEVNAVFSVEENPQNFYATNPIVYLHEGPTSYVPNIGHDGWGNLKTNLESAPNDAKAIVLYYDTTLCIEDSITATGQGFSKLNDMAEGIYATWGQKRSDAKNYGVSQELSGELGGDFEWNMVFPTRSYGYKIITLDNMVSGSKVSDGAIFNFRAGFDNFYLGNFGYILNVEDFITQINADFAASKARIDDARKKINAIGTVTADSGAVIAAARAAYDLLDADNEPEDTRNPEKNLADPTGILAAAERRYDQIINPDNWTTINLLIEGKGAVTVNGVFYEENTNVLVGDTETVTLQLQRKFKGQFSSLKVKDIDVTSQVSDKMYTFIAGPDNFTVKASFEDIDEENYVILNPMEDGDVTFSSSEPLPGIKDNLPTISADFSKIPIDAEALIFEFDSSEIVSGGSENPFFIFNFISKGQIKGKSEKLTHEVYIKDKDSGITIITDPLLNRFTLQPGKKGYVVIPFSREKFSQVGINLSVIEELRLENGEWVYGADFIGKTVHIRNFGYLGSKAEFSESIKEPYEREIQKPTGNVRITAANIQGTFATVSWDETPEAYTYRVNLYSESGGFLSTELFREATGRINNLKPATTYKVQVMAVDIDLELLNYSQILSFRTTNENTESYMLGLLDDDGKKTKGLYISGTTVTVYWDWIEGVSYYEAHLYEIVNGEPVYLRRDQPADGLGMLSFLLLFETDKRFALQLIAYDMSGSIIFAYEPDFFTLADKSTYIPSENGGQNSKTDSGYYEDGYYKYETVTNIVTIPGQSTTYIQGDPGGKWKREYDYVLNIKMVVLLVSIGVITAGGITAGVILIINYRKKKKAKLSV